MAVTIVPQEWEYPPIRLTIPSYYVSETLVDFPLMIRLSESSGVDRTDVSQVVSMLGNTRRFCIANSDGVTPLYTEIKEWDVSKQTAILFTKVPKLTHDVDTNLYLYYDPTHPTITTHVGDIGSSAGQSVWSNGYAGVWHMKPTALTKKTLYSGERSDSASGGRAANAYIKFTPVDCNGLTKDNGWLKIDLKCNYPENITTERTDRTQLELTSSGTCDQQEWSMVDIHLEYGLSTEWRTYYIPLSKFYDRGGSLDVSRINYIRWYVWTKSGASSTTISWRNAEIVSTAALPSGTPVNVVFDSTANRNHGIVYGTTPSWGLQGTGLSFNGDGDEIRCGSVPVNSENATFELLWAPGMDTDTLPANRWFGGIGTYGAGAYGNSSGIYLGWASWERRWVIGAPTASYTSNRCSVGSRTNMKSETSYYITGIKTNQDVSVYRDGVYDGAANLAYPATTTFATDFRIASAATGYLPGEIQIVMFSNIVRSPAWINAMNASLRDEMVVYNHRGTKRSHSTAFGSTSMMIV